MTTVGVVIPHVPTPERDIMLRRAKQSVYDQTYAVAQLEVVTDTEHEGPGVTRTRGLEALTTDWALYLDDDDHLNTDCVERLMACAEETGADVVYPWFRVGQGDDPFPMFFGQPWEDEHPHIFPITYLVRTEIALKAGGFPSHETMGARYASEWDGAHGGEDWYAIEELIKVKAKIVHLPERLWTWEHGGHKHYSGAKW